MKTLNYNFTLKSLFSILLFCSVAALLAQPTNYMVMKKNGKKKRYTFIEGQEITYKVKGDIGFMSDFIRTITDSTIEFADYTLPFNNIETIKIKKKKHFLMTNNGALSYGVSLGVSAAILETAYIINTGKGVYNFGTQLAVLSSPIPTILLSNWIYSWFVKTEYTIAPDEYQFYPIILRKD